jgi:hypothetical protein
VDESSVSFRIWVRKSARAQRPFSVRFEVFDGKASCASRARHPHRSAARVSGFEEQLSASSSRLPVSSTCGAPAGSDRATSSRASTTRARSPRPDNWYELTVVTDGGYRYLELESLFRDAGGARRAGDQAAAARRDPVAAAAPRGPASRGADARAPARDGSSGSVRRARREHGARAPPAPEAPGRGAPEFDPHARVSALEAELGTRR